MKIGHIGDLHFGIKSDSSDFHEIHVELIDWIIEKFLASGVQKIIFYGDLFHNRNEINVKTLNIVYKIVLKLSSAFECYFIIGNHDTYYKSEIKVNSMNIFDNISNIHIIDTPTELDNMLLVPWIINKKEFYTWLQKQNKTWDYICGHFEFRGGQVSQTIASWHGMDVKVIEQFVNKKILTGHFHLKRHFSKNTFYLGTPLSLTWADVDEEKCVYVQDADNFVEIVNNISPKFIRIPISKMSKEKILLIKDNFIKIIIDIPTDEEKIQKLTDILRAQEPASLQVSSMSYSDLQSAIELEQKRFELNDPWAFVKKYIEEIDLPDNINQETLLKKVADIYREAIVE